MFVCFELYLIKHGSWKIFIIYMQVLVCICIIFDKTWILEWVKMNRECKVEIFKCLTEQDSLATVSDLVLHLQFFPMALYF